MMTFFTDYAKEIFATGILIAVTISTRVIVTQIVRRYARKEHFLEHRTILIIKYIHLLTNILFIIGLFIVWGVKTDDIFLTVSSIATVIGVAMFAQWSILSNITSGVILFFSFPFKIGDSIKIHDKDFPIEAEIEDINAFHVSLKTKEGEKIIYPNNLLLQKGISIISAQFEDKEFFD
jgi:small-conductance mechanosensitive channel